MEDKERIEGTVGGSRTGPTCDAEGVPLHDGDHVRIVHMDDPKLQYLVGKEAVCEVVQDMFPYASVCLVIGTEGQPDWIPISTYSAWTRKVS